MKKTSFIKPTYFLLLFVLFVISRAGASNATSEKQPQTEQITLADGTSVTEIIDSETGTDFSIALRPDGTVLGKGNNQHGRLGIGITSEDFFTPIETSAGILKDVDQISCTETTYCCF